MIGVTLNKIKRFGYILFGAGAALLGEHIVTYGYTEWEIFGHETVGLIAILISFVLLARREK